MFEIEILSLVWKMWQFGTANFDKVLSFLTIELINYIFQISIAGVYILHALPTDNTLSLSTSPIKFLSVRVKRLCVILDNDDNAMI